MARMMAGNSKFHDQSLRDQAARLLSALLFPALFIHEREFTPPLTDEITSILLRNRHLDVEKQFCSSGTKISKRKG